MKVCRHTLLTDFMFILLSIGDIRFSHLNFDDSCSYINKEYTPNMDSSKYLKELKIYCNKLKPFVSYYFKLIKSYNNTVYDILENKIKPLLPKCQDKNVV